jgi:hypothetical protein
MPRPEMLFVVGLGRSGTGAITRLLSEHPDVAVGLERFKFFMRDPEFRLSREYFTHERFFDFEDGGTNISPLVDDRWTEYYDNLEAKWDDARYVGDKMTNLRFPVIWDNMPAARVVCIVRDIREVAASWNVRATNPNDKGWPEHRDAEAAVTAWNNSLARLERLKGRRGNKIEVVENGRLFGDPDGASIKRICGWLDLEWTPEYAAAFEASHQHYAGYVQQKDRTLAPEVEEFIAENADLTRWQHVLDAYA